LEPLDPKFEIYTYQQVFTPDQKLDIHVLSYRVHELQCAIYRVPAGELKQHKSIWVRRPAELLANKVPFSKWVKQMEIKDITRWQTRTISFPLSRNGFYVLQIESKSKTKYVPIFYTDLGLIVKSIPTTTLVWSHRLTDSLPVTAVGIESEYPNTNSSKMQGATDSQGLLQFQESSTQNFTVWAFHNADAAYAEIYQGYNQSNSLKAYIYTDRPVYRPGHTVQYKGILRREKGDVYEVLADQEFDLRIRDATGTLIHQEENLRTNRHGSFSGRLKLTDEPSLGTYQIEVIAGSSQFGQFKVLEYRKPEFEIKLFPDKQRYLNGETIQTKISATYYFGAPVANQKVDYSVLDSAYYSWGYQYWDDSYSEEFGADYDYYGYGRVVTTGSVQLNENGEATLSIPAGKENYDRYFNIEARITDQSRREVTGRSRVLVTRAEYKIGVFADSWVYTTGDNIRLRVKASDFDDVPVSVKVQIYGSFAHWNKKSYRYDYSRQWSQEVQTDKNGSAHISFAASRSGYLQIEAVAEDTRGNRIDDSRHVWIAGQDEEYADWYNQRGLELIPDKKKKNPGEEAKLLIHSPVRNVHALITFEGSSLHKAEVVKLRGSTRLITFTALAQHAPSLYVSVCFSQRKQFYNRTIAFDISSTNQFLNVDITSDKAKYKPRETAKYSIRIQDASGRPVATEFSFGLVDESIYAVSPELAPDIQKFFYGPRPNRVFTYYSFPPRYLGGADKDANKQIRKDFPDTAYWNASARTDSNGTAIIEVPLPDSLTTWRATVRAATDQTKVGSAIQKIITAKNLIARLETPRFFTAGDTLLVTGVFHNLSDKPLEIKTQLSVDQSLELKENSQKKLKLASQQIRRLDWKLQALKPGSTRIILAADAEADFDGMQLDIPVLPFGIQRFVAFSGQSNATTTRNFTLPEKGDLATAHLELYFTPSIAGLAFDSLEYLTGYPYGCVEQTMSRFLPDIVVEQALKQLKITNEQLSRELPKQINAGLQRLYHFQHEDGGWGWWEHDESHPYMTAYVVYGLSLAKQAGYAVDENRMTQGASALKL
ncbi:MAG TPA: MG2 domain-containing protein, partial [Acidobacteriota bacterium]|nr:MG2 domain-containing protein [Acidobacteriota bacterium]